MKVVSYVEMVKETITKDCQNYEPHFYDENHNRIFINKGEQYMVAADNSIHTY